MDQPMEPQVLSRRGRTTAETTVADRQLAEQGFAAIYEAHHRDVYRYVLALTRSHADAEDISAATFERAYRQWRGDVAAVERVLPWLLLTARRIATDRWRRARRLARLLPSIHAAPQPSSEHGQTEFWLWFDAVCEVLPDRQREVLVLRYQRDLTDADIGSIMGLSESGVRSLVSRAIANLRAHPELLS